ncbi:hypothetical protein HMPREF9622_02450 [Cutibacterium modestum HL037PA3]|nr:hypothetical protein HMPREF9622_02450 [Cutibacterium modestum HL037PA3]
MDVPYAEGRNHTKVKVTVTAGRATGRPSMYPRSKNFSPGPTIGPCANHGCRRSWNAH